MKDTSFMRILSKQPEPRKNSKSHIKKEAKRAEMVSRKIVCEKCGKNTTLFNIQEHYYCQECR